MLTTILASIAGAGLFGALLKHFDADIRVGDFAEALGFQLFSKLTLVLNTTTMGLWNKTLEPLLESFIGRFAKGAGRGLNSDEV